LADFLLTATLVCLAVQAAHYIGYPLALYTLSGLFGRPWRRDVRPATVTLIVPAYNEAAAIAEKIENSLALDWPALEIVVVSDGSTDDTTEIAARYVGRGIRLLVQPERRGKAEALNRAVETAGGEILVLSDAHTFYAPDAITKLVRNFADPEVGCVTGRKFVRSPGPGRPLSAVGRSESAYWRYESRIKVWESRLDSTMGTMGAMLALRRPLYSPIPAGIINDDVFLPLMVLRRGKRVIYEPEAVCWEPPTASSGEDVKRRKRMTAGRYQLLMRPSFWPWRKPRAVAMLLCHKLLRLLLPLFMIGALAANTAAMLVPPVPSVLWLTLIAQAGFYGLAALGFVGERRQRRWRLPALAWFVTAGNLSALAGLSRYLSGRQTVVWDKAAHR
jgi:cellulose synthase/poly-beta-1,6-N-acetylglucosamine synthase-like glycosyltransferase